MGDNGQPAVGNAGPDERVSMAALLAAMELIRTEFRGINGGGCRLARAGPLGSRAAATRLSPTPSGPDTTMRHSAGRSGLAGGRL